MTKVIWLGFLLSEARLKNPNGEQRLSLSLGFGMHEVNEVIIHKLAKALGCFEGSSQYVLSYEKTNPTPDRLLTEPGRESHTSCTR